MLQSANPTVEATHKKTRPHPAATVPVRKAQTHVCVAQAFHHMVQRFLTLAAERALRHKAQRFQTSAPTSVESNIQHQLPTHLLFSNLTGWLIEGGYLFALF